ncbi:MAG: hypothetical protein RL383_837 [Actinomycetota bacterium]|jgi:hypothetical protein
MSTVSAGAFRPAVVMAVLRRPGLWPTAVRQVLRMAPRGWWRRPPFLPVPPADYVEFRLVTQYGGEYLRSGGRVVPADVVDYLRWCRDWDRQG